MWDIVCIYIIYDRQLMEKPFVDSCSMLIMCDHDIDYREKGEAHKV